MLRALPSPGQVAELYAKMPAFLERALLPFQREGVRFGLAHGGRCLIAGALGGLGCLLACHLPAGGMRPMLHCTAPIMHGC